MFLGFCLLVLCRIVYEDPHYPKTPNPLPPDTAYGLRIPSPRLHSQECSNPVLSIGANNSVEGIRSQGKGPGVYKDNA